MIVTLMISTVSLLTLLFRWSPPPFLSVRLSLLQKRNTKIELPFKVNKVSYSDRDVAIASGQFSLSLLPSPCRSLVSTVFPLAS